MSRLVLRKQANNALTRKKIMPPVFLHTNRSTQQRRLRISMQHDVSCHVAMKSPSMLPFQDKTSIFGFEEAKDEIAVRKNTR